jgi:hypothetical protein
VFLSNVNKRMGNDGSLRSPMWVRLKVMPLIRFYPRKSLLRSRGRLHPRPCKTGPVWGPRRLRSAVLELIAKYELLTGTLLKILMSLSLSN